MYCHHFGFTKSPFKITPDPELFFAGGKRGAVLDALVYAVSRGEGIVKVVGEVGSGKTMLCRMLDRELPAACERIYLANPNLGPHEILHAIAFELGLNPPVAAAKPALMHLVHDYLLAKHAANRRVVMFVEEAQAMPNATLEELRLLSNLETADDKLLQIVLFGQPEFDSKLAAHEIRQLNERITYRFTLAPLTAVEVRDYLHTRLHACGYRSPELFSRSAIRRLTTHSRGLLRRINVLADKALLAAYSDNSRVVQARHITLAVNDSEYRHPRWFAWRGRLALMLGSALLAGAWWQGFLQPSTPAEITNAARRGVEPSIPTAGYTDLTLLSSLLGEVESDAHSAAPASEANSVSVALARLARVSDPVTVLTLAAEPTLESH